MSETKLSPVFSELEEILRQAEWAARAIEQSYRTPDRVASTLVARARDRVMDIRRSLEAEQLPRAA